MRRKDREITDFGKMLDVMEQCGCCRLGFRDGESIYIVPLNFGYKAAEGRLVLYFHGASEGKKIDLAKTQPYVGFEMDTEHELVEHETACGHSWRYQSIIGEGRLSLVEDSGAKRSALRCIMSHYSDRPDWEFKEKMVGSVAVMKLEVTAWSCKAHGSI